MTSAGTATDGFSLMWSTIHAPHCGGAIGSGPYNPCMFHTLTSSFQAALLERLTLLVNHVLAAEPVATDRLRAHSGRSLQVQLDAWPAPLPALPGLSFRVTPAGLLEWCGPEALSNPELRLRVDASNPALAIAQWATGVRPRVEVQGDAQFAADLSWLMDNLRWDVQDDLARLVGQAPAHQVARIARVLANGLRDAVRTLSLRRGGGVGAAGEPGPAPK